MPQPSRVLIVDDEPAIRNLLKAVFTSAGYEVRLAGSGSEAVAACENERFDLLLSDIQMPGGMSGHQLVQWCATWEPRMRRILMTGYDDAGCRRCTVMPTRCTVVTKPFLSRDLLALAETVLAQPL